MIADFHTHVLPRVDDGSASLEESLAMLRMEAQQGVHHVVATPHFYPRHDDPERFLARRAQAEKRLRECVSQEPGLPEITVGAEVYFFSGISDSEALERLTIGENRFILIEMKQSPWGEYVYRELENIYLKQGLTPIVAHVDRYISPFHTYGIPERLADLPVLVQANADFFLRRATRSMALRMLKKGQIHLLGSDCHNVGSRPPQLGEAVQVIRKRLGNEVLAQVENNGFNVFGTLNKL